MEKHSFVLRRFARSLTACAIFATAVVFVAPNPASAASNKITICHRTRSVTNPYRRITVNRNAVNNSGHGNASHSGGVFNTTAGHYNTNPKDWGDIIPGGDSDGTPYNGDNNFDANWDAAGKAIFLPTGVNASKCPSMTAKQFYDAVTAVDGGYTPSQAITELNTMAANEDSDLKAALPGGTFSLTNLSTWETTITANTNDASAINEGTGAATLNGSFKYKSGTSVRYFFQIDNNSSFSSPDNTTETKDISAPFAAVTATGSDQAVSVNVTGLANGLWYFRLVSVTNWNTDTEAILYANIKTLGIGVPTITTDSLPDGLVGTAYNQSLASAGGVAPRSNYLVASGSLPTSLNMSTGGAITGTPSVKGLFTFGATVQDSTGGTPQTSATKTLTIRIKSPQVITIPDPGTMTYGDPTFSANPSTTVTNDEINNLGTYTYSGTSGVCDVDAAGTVTITGAGTCTITVNHTGNGYFLTGSNTRSFTVNPKPITIKADDKSKEVDGTDPAFTYAITVGALVGSDAISGLTYTHSSSSYTASTTVPNVVGSYTITPSAAVFSAGVAANYTITYLTGTLTVSAASTTTSSSTSTTAAPATTAAATTTTKAPTTTVPKVDPRKTTDNPFVNISADPKPNGKSTGGSLTLDGDPPMEVLSVTSSDPTVSIDVTKSGVEYNKPETWVAEGFGDECWKIEPGGSAYILPAVPTPPSGKTGYYSMVKVKAGSITSTDPNFQVNTIFPSPVGGDRVWPDSNRNGIYDAGGKNGDKDISHIILCIRYGSPSATTTTTPAAVAGSTTTTVSSGGATTTTVAGATTTTTAAGSSSTSSSSSSTTAPASSTSSTTPGSSGSSTSSSVAATTPGTPTTAGSGATSGSTTSTTAAAKGGATTTSTLPIDAKDTDGPKDNIVLKVAAREVKTAGQSVVIVMRMSTGTEESVVKMTVDVATMQVEKVQAQSVSAVDVDPVVVKSNVVVRVAKSTKQTLPATGSDSGSMLPWVFVLLSLGVVIRFFGRWVARR